MSTIVDKAIRSGKFPESRRAHYERAFARDPEGTSRLIASLEALPGIVGRFAEARSVPGGRRGRIESSAGLPLRPHPMGGYYVESL